MKQKICDFETVFEGKKIIKNSRLVGLSFHKRFRLKESRLRIHQLPNYSEDQLPFSVLSIITYPEDPVSNVFFANNSRFCEFVEQLIYKSILHFILQKKIILDYTTDSFEFLNGVTQDDLYQYLFSQEEALEETGWLEKNLVLALQKASKNNQQRVPLPLLIVTLLDQLITKVQKNNFCYEYLANNYLRAVTTNYSWLSGLPKKDNKWFQTKTFRDITIHAEQKIRLQSDFDQINTWIEKAIHDSPAFTLFAQELKEEITHRIAVKLDSE